MNVNVLDKISYIHIDGHAHNIAQIVDIKSEKIASKGGICMKRGLDFAF